MPTMNVSLTEDLARFIEGEVNSGEYGTASEVVRDALRLLLRDRATRDERLAILRREVQIGLDQARDGRLSPRTIGEIAAAVRDEGAV